MWSLLKIQRPVATLTDKCLVLDIDETLVHTFDDGERINKNMIWNDPNLLELRRRIYEIELIDIAGIRKRRLLQNVRYNETLFERIFIFLF